MQDGMSRAAWPALPWPEWEETHAALQCRMQLLGKFRLCTPWTNHSWHVTLPLSTRGIGTGPLPDGDRFWEADFDFLDHVLRIVVSDGSGAVVPLRPQPVAQFYEGACQAMRGLGIAMRVSTQPCEIEALPFERDTDPRPYDADAVQRWWRTLLQVDRVLRIFRARFCGKCSPVHFFWGAMDLAVSRFSGRRAPLHPGGVPHLADWVVREAYSHEVSSCGFWAGAGLGEPAFYSYIYPEPAGYPDGPVRPPAYYHPKLREFILPYAAVRAADDPDAMVLEFLQSTYEAAADRAHWDRAALECKLP